MTIEEFKNKHIQDTKSMIREAIKTIYMYNKLGGKLEEVYNLTSDLLKELNKYDDENPGVFKSDNDIEYWNILHDLSQTVLNVTNLVSYETARDNITKDLKKLAETIGFDIGEIDNIGR